MAADLIAQGVKHARAILTQCVTPRGFRASARHDGYPQVWARDSVITFLGALTTGDRAFTRAGRASLETLGAYQSPRGLIPLNVNPDTGRTSSENAGALDSNLWFILGHYLHYLLTRDAAFTRAHWAALDRALVWLEFQDMNECGLLEIPEAGDWMDLLAVRYNVLYDNVLYYAALLAHQELARVVAPKLTAHRVTIDATGVSERINLLMWVDRCWVAEHFAAHLERLKAMRLEWYMLYHNIGTISSRPFYLPWVAFREYGDWCDSLGNVLAILTGIAGKHRAAHILRYLDDVGMAEPYPTKAIYPPIFPGESNWRDYYRSRNLNLPHQYHNGGIWSMIGGFHIAALVRQGWMREAKGLLKLCAQANQRGHESAWEFNEWMHGETGRPMGYPLQAWSAAMFLYAEHAVRTGALPLFDELLAAKPYHETEEDAVVYKTPGGGPG